MDDLLTPDEMFELLETPQKMAEALVSEALVSEALTPLEMLYTAFEDQYDEPSIDAVYLMNDCQFDPTYEMLLLPFWTAIENDTQILKEDQAKLSVNKLQVTRQSSSSKLASSSRSSSSTAENRPTTKISLADFIVPERGNRKHKKK